MQDFLDIILMCVLFLPVTVPTKSGLEQCSGQIVRVTPYAGLNWEAGPYFGQVGLRLGKQEDPEDQPIN